MSLKQANKNYDKKKEEIKTGNSYCNEIRNSIFDIRSIVNKSPVVVFIYKADVNWSVEYVSENIIEILGYSPQDFYSGKLHFADIIHPEDLPQIAIDVAKVSAKKKSDDIHAEYRMITKANETIWIEHRAWPKQNAQGRITHFQSMLIDITKRKHSQKELNEHRDHLEELVCKRTRDLRKSNQELLREINDRKRTEKEKIKLEQYLRQSQKMEALGTLAGGIAHDFNNSLAAICGYAELSLLQNKENEVLRANLEKILKAIQHSKNLVNQILTFSRPSTQEYKPIDLSQIITEVQKLLRASLPATIQIIQNMEVKNCRTLADQTQINQVLMNLCTNGAFAMRDTGGVLEIHLSEVNLRAEDLLNYPELKAGAYLKISVKDSGHGIDEADLDRIFDPFFTTKKPGEGTGMGLSVVHGIIQSHTGAIRVLSKQGEGTTISILLPKIEQEAVAITNIFKAVSKKINKARILFVDDQNNLAEAGQKLLEHVGYDVIVYTCSIDALNFFRTQHKNIHLVITDMTMPNMTGTDLSKKLLQIRPDIPIILCTGFNAQINIKKAKALGIQEMLMKPFSAHELTSTIDKVLEYREL